MSSHGGAQEARGPRRNEQDFRQRAGPSNVDPQRQGAGPFAGQQGLARVPHALPPGFPQQAQPPPLGPAQPFAAAPSGPSAQFASGPQRPPGRPVFPAAAQRLALQPGAAIPQPYAAFYPPFQPYSYLAPGAGWHPMLGQQMVGFPQQPPPMQAGLAYPVQPGLIVQPGQQEGRQGRGRGRGRRHTPQRGRSAPQQGAQQYRDMWQQATQARRCNFALSMQTVDFVHLALQQTPR